MLQEALEQSMDIGILGTLGLYSLSTVAYVCFLFMQKKGMHRYGVWLLLAAFVVHSLSVHRPSTEPQGGEVTRGTDDEKGKRRKDEDRGRNDRRERGDRDKRRRDDDSKSRDDKPHKRHKS